MKNVLCLIFCASSFLSPRGIGADDWENEVAQAWKEGLITKFSWL